MTRQQDKMKPTTPQALTFFLSLLLLGCPQEKASPPDLTPPDPLVQVRALMLTGDHTSAAALLGPLSARRPKNAELAWLHGKALAGAGQGGQAIKAFGVALALAPLQRIIHWDLIKALSSGGHDADLIKAIRQALLLWPNDAALHLTLSRALARQGKAAQARSAARMHRFLGGKDLSEEDPSPPDPASPWAPGEQAMLAPAHQRSLEAAQDLERRGELERSATAYREVLRQAPGAGGAYIGLGRILSRQGNAGHAQGMFIKALLLSPLHAGELVRSLAEEGKAEEAQEALSKVIAQALKEPEPDSVFLQRLGIQLRDTGQLEQAETLLRAAIKARPGDPALEHDLAAMLKRKEVIK